MKSLKSVTQSAYKAQSARDAESSEYGSKSYWNHLEQSAHEHYAYYMRKGDPKTAAEMLTRSLSDSLRGNDGA